MKALRVGFLDNKYGSGRCIEIQKTGPFEKVFSTRLAKDCLKKTQTQIGTVRARQSTDTVRLGTMKEEVRGAEQQRNIWNVIIARSYTLLITERLKVLQSIVVPPGEYPINRVSNPETTTYLSHYQGNT
jgi:hypothetical protein